MKIKILLWDLAPVQLKGRKKAKLHKEINNSKENDLQASPTFHSTVERSVKQSVFVGFILEIMKRAAVVGN